MFRGQLAVPHCLCEGLETSGYRNLCLEQFPSPMNRCGSGSEPSILELKLAREPDRFVFISIGIPSVVRMHGHRIRLHIIPVEKPDGAARDDAGEPVGTT